MVEKPTAFFILPMARVSLVPAKSCDYSYLVELEEALVEADK
jgi:hypothetical protein